MSERCRTPASDTLALVALRGREDLLDQILAPAIHGAVAALHAGPVAKIYFERLRFEELVVPA